MFCDLVGSTTLVASLDPEDLREVLGAYHRTVGDTIAAGGRFVAKYQLAEWAKTAIAAYHTHEADAGKLLDRTDPSWGFASVPFQA